VQSLTLANDQQFIEIAQGLAVRALNAAVAPTTPGCGTPSVCVCRGTKPGESARLAKLLAQQRAEFAANLKEAERLTPALVPVKANVQDFAAWTAVARVC